MSPGTESAGHPARMPDFLILGAARAGTTALYRYLRQNPSIFMPSAKEPNFFAFEGEELNISGPGADYINNSVTQIADYHALFSDAPAGAQSVARLPRFIFTRPRRPSAYITMLLRCAWWSFCVIR